MVSRMAWDHVHASSNLVTLIKYKVRRRHTTFGRWESYGRSESGQMVEL